MQQVYVAEEWVKNSRDETRAAYEAREIVEAHPNALKDQQKQMAEQVKKAFQDKASAEAGLRTTEKQAETLRSELHLCEINLATERQMVKDLHEELRKAKEAAQLLKEAAEAEKQASYALGVQETQSRLTEKFLLSPGTTVTLLGKKPLMPLESLLIPTLGGLRAYIMILIFRRSQVPTLLLQSSQPRHLKPLQQVRLLQLLWKSQQIPIKTLVKERGLRLPRIRLRMLPLLS